MKNVTAKWKAFSFVWWGVGLLFIGVVASRFIWPTKLVDVKTPAVAFSKDVCPGAVRTTLMESGQLPPDILRMRVKVSTRTECKDEVQVALVARMEDNTTDRMTDNRIEKSDLFSEPGRPLAYSTARQDEVTRAGNGLAFIQAIP